MSIHLDINKLSYAVETMKNKPVNQVRNKRNFQTS